MICTSYEIKRFDITHLAQVKGIERAAFKIPWSAAMIRDSLQAAHTQVYGIYTDHDQLAGYVALSMVLDEVELLSMAVMPTYQKQGYGRALLEYVIKTTQARGAKVIFLEVRRSNQSALSLYLSEGFQVIGQRIGYYPAESAGQPREDAVLLSLSL